MFLIVYFQTIFSLCVGLELSWEFNPLKEQTVNILEFVEPMVSHRDLYSVFSPAVSLLFLENSQR